MMLADSFLAQIPDHSVTLFDKGFWSVHLMLSLRSPRTVKMSKTRYPVDRNAAPLK